MRLIHIIGKSFLTAILFFALSNSGFAQINSKEYAFVMVEGKQFSDNLKVTVDFGDESAQLKKSKGYTSSLANKKSYVAVLHYMLQAGYELVDTVPLNSQSQGSGGTNGIGYLLRKRSE